MEQPRWLRNLKTKRREPEAGPGNCQATAWRRPRSQMVMGSWRQVWTSSRPAKTRKLGSMLVPSDLEQAKNIRSDCHRRVPRTPGADGFLSRNLPDPVSFADVKADIAVDDRSNEEADKGTNDHDQGADNSQPRGDHNYEAAENGAPDLPTPLLHSALTLSASDGAGSCTVASTFPTFIPCSVRTVLSFSCTFRVKPGRSTNSRV